VSVTGPTGATGLTGATGPSALTTKGDIATFDTAVARLAVGANGESLVADSSTSTGLRYTAGTVQANPVLNSAMQVWQRGTSSAIGASGSYIPDRWICARNAGAAGGTVSRQLTNDTTNLPNIQYCARVQRDSGNTSTSAISISQVFESVNSIPYAGKTVTISFYGRAGANYSSASSALPFRLRTGTGTDQNPITVGYTGGANPVTSTATLTTTWQRFSATGTLAATATEMSFIFEETPVGTAGADDYYEVTGMQIDIGSVALPFRTYAATLQGELAACQRYYYQTNPGGGSLATTHMVSGSAYTTNAIGQIYCAFPVTMRSNPSATINNTGLSFWNGTGAVTSSSSILNQSSSTTQGTLNITCTGATVGTFYNLISASTGTGHIAFSAEL
jgi:hypothetical protein